MLVASFVVLCFIGLLYLIFKWNEEKEQPDFRQILQNHLDLFKQSNNSELRQLCKTLENVMYHPEQVNTETIQELEMIGVYLRSLNHFKKEEKKQIIQHLKPHVNRANSMLVGLH